MANPRFAWGIDIGNRALKAVKLIRSAEGLRVDDFELIEHETVLSNAGDNRETLIQSALANFLQRHPIKGGAVAVGVSGQSSFARFIKLPPVEPKKIPEIVRFEAIQQIPFPLDDVEWSYQLFQDPESPDVEVGIFAMRKELIQRNIKDYTDYDLNVQVVQMNPLAVYNGLYQDSRFDGTTMVIDMGAENTDLIIADNETIWMRSIPFGGNSFTQTLEKAFKLPFAKAEELKRNASTSKYARQIFQAMRPNFADLVGEIQRSMGFYASVHKDSQIKKVLALGGTFRLPGLQKYLQQNLQLDIEGIDSLGAGSPTDAKLAAMFNENLRASAAAYGLAVQAMGEGKITSSLLPTEIRRAKIWKEKTKWFAAAAALFVVGTGIAAAKYSVQNFQYTQAAPLQLQIANITKQATALDTQWSTVSSAGDPDRLQIQNVKALIAYRSLWRDILGSLAAAIPAPDPALAAALDSGNKDLLMKFPRGQRNLVSIDSIATKFFGDIAPVLADSQIDRYVIDTPEGFSPDVSSAMIAAVPDAGLGNPDLGNQMPGGPPVPAAPAASSVAAGTRGFTITIKCTSPNQNALSLINNKFIQNLMAIKPNAAHPHMEFMVMRAVMTRANPIGQDPARLAKLKSQFDSSVQAQRMADEAMAIAQRSASAGHPGSSPPPPAQGFPGDPNAAAGQPNEDDAYKDRLTGEDMRNDWEFTVLVVVALDPPAFVPPAVPAGSPGPAALNTDVDVRRDAVASSAGGSAVGN